MYFEVIQALVLTWLYNRTNMLFITIVIKHSINSIPCHTKCYLGGKKGDTLLKRASIVFWMKYVLCRIAREWSSKTKLRINFSSIAGYKPENSLRYLS